MEPKPIYRAGPDDDENIPPKPESAAVTPDELAALNVAVQIAARGVLAARNGYVTLWPRMDELQRAMDAIDAAHAKIEARP